MSEDRTQFPGTSSAIVARGESLLSILSQKAAAARAEADCAELRMLLDEAHAGQPVRLERWLAMHAGDPYHSATLERLTSPREPERLHARISSIDSWDQMLPAARARLRRRAQWLRDKQGRETPPADAKRSTEPQQTQTEAVKFTPQPIERKQQQHRQQTRFRKWRGIVVSFLAHAALVLLLGLVTLRLPAPPASLALESASTDVATEALEFREPLEITEPDVPSDVSPLPSVDLATFDVTENFADVGSTVSLPVGTQSSQANSLSAATLLTGGGSASSLANALQSSSSFFGAAASGNCFCYVIDGSGSMRGGPWDAAKIELFKSLASLKQTQRFYIVFFNRELSAIPLPGEREPAPHTLYATPENVQHARRWMDTLRIDIGAPPNLALELAISKEPDAIYLLTDGVTQSDVLGFLRRRNRTQDTIFGEQVRVPIHTIAFYSLDGQELLQQIAAENNGQFIYVPDPKQR